MEINEDSKIVIFGGTGLVGSAFQRTLQSQGYKNIYAPLRDEVNLFEIEGVCQYLKQTQPELVVNAAARVGGIKANTTFPFDFIYENLLIQMNTLKCCLDLNIDRLLNFCSNCSYPKNSPQPMKEEYLLTGPLELTNEPYAISKIAGLKLIESLHKQHHKKYLNVIPCSVYGPNDNFNVDVGHVIPGLIRRISDAISKDQKFFDVWGSGLPKREFMYVDDLVDACMFLLKQNDLPYSWLNVGTGSDISIKSLAVLVADEMKFKGKLRFDTSKPDGMPLKCLDSTRMQTLGWKPKTSFQEGLERTIHWFYNHIHNTTN